MSVLFVVTSGEYSDYHICGIFSTRELANAAIAAVKDGEVEEWPLDPHAPELKRGAYPYFVRLNRDSGNVEDLHRCDSWYGVFDPLVGVDIHKNLYTTVWAADKDEAVKIASERRRLFLAGLDAFVEGAR